MSDGEILENALHQIPADVKAIELLSAYFAQFLQIIGRDKYKYLLQNEGRSASVRQSRSDMEATEPVDIITILQNYIDMNAVEKHLRQGLSPQADLHAGSHRPGDKYDVSDVIVQSKASTSKRKLYWPSTPKPATTPKTTRVSPTPTTAPVAPEKTTATKTEADALASSTANTLVSGAERLVNRRKKRRSAETTGATKKLTEMTLDERAKIAKRIAEMSVSKQQSLQSQIETAISELKAKFLKENRYAATYTDNMLEDEALKKYQCEDLMDMYLQVGLMLEAKNNQ